MFLSILKTSHDEKEWMQFTLGCSETSELPSLTLGREFKHILDEMKAIPIHVFAIIQDSWHFKDSLSRELFSLNQLRK